MKNLTDTTKQLEHWTKRADELKDWLFENSPSHPNWEQKRRDLSIALRKIEELNARGDKPKYNTQKFTVYQHLNIKISWI